METQHPLRLSPPCASGLSTVKDAEKKLAAPRVWQKLSGVAKSVVKHLEPKDFSSENGMEKLLSVLRESAPEASDPG